MNMLQMIFRDSQGRVRWGYKFFTLILIVELLLPVFLIFASGVGLAAFMPFLASKGIIDAQGMVTAPYQEAVQTVWMIALLSLQNLLLTGLCLLFWRLVMRKKIRQMGYAGGMACCLRELGIGFLMGAVMILLASALILLSGAGSIRPSGQEDLALWLPWYAFLFVLVGFGEETAFRGYAMGTMEQTGNPALICGFTGLIFGMAHSANNNFSMMGFLNIALVGVFLAMLVLKSGRLWTSIGFHIAWNFTQGCIVGFPVSGMGTSSLFTMGLSGSQLLTGGAFGAEGSILTTVVVAVGIVLLYKAPGRRAEG